jgi:hypothetical protein
MSGMVENSALALDQVCYPRRGPQTTRVPQRFRSTLQPAFDPPQLFWTQLRFAAGPTRPSQGPQSALLQLLRPAAHRLPMRSYSAGDFGRVHALPQQFGRLPATLF